MRPKVVIPILLSNETFPMECLDTYIDCAKDFLTKEKMNELVEKHIENLEQDKSEYDKELIFIRKTYFDMAENMYLDVNSVIASQLSQKNIDMVTVFLNPKDVTVKNLKYLKKNKIKNVELNAYSSNEQVLERFGTNFKQLKKACMLLKLFKINVGLHQLVGLENMSYLSNLETAKKFVKLKPNYVRINNLYITKGSCLEKLYLEKKYTPYTTEKLTDLLNEVVQIYNRNEGKKAVPTRFGFYELFGEEKYYEQNFSEIIDIGVNKTPIYKVENKKVIQVGKLNKKTKNDAKFNFEKRVVAGSYDKNLKQILENNIWYDAIAQKIKKLNSKVKKIEIEVNPFELELAIGKDEVNKNKLKDVYDIEINFVNNENIEQGEIKLNVIE